MPDRPPADESGSPVDPETSSITKLRETLDELERWQSAFERGEVAEAPDQQLLEQIRTILTRRKKRQTSKQIQLGQGPKKK